MGSFNRVVEFRVPKAEVTLGGTVGRSIEPHEIVQIHDLTPHQDPMRAKLLDEAHRMRVTPGKTAARGDKGKWKGK